MKLQETTVLRNTFPCVKWNFLLEKHRTAVLEGLPPPYICNIMNRQQLKNEYWLRLFAACFAQLTAY